MTRFTHICAWTLLAGLFGGIPARIHAGDWTRFHGPNGTGIANNAHIPTEIGEASHLRWKVEIPGTGNSSPIVCRERIFLQSASEDGSQRLMVCLALADGKILWARPVPGNSAKKHKKNTLASATAATDGTRVYMTFWDGSLLSASAYDFEGNVIWNQPIGEVESQHGSGHSPIVVAGKVVISNDHDNTAEVVALDADDGRVAWRMPRPLNRSGYSTPILLDENAAEPQVVIVSTSGATGYDVASGTVRWNWNWRGNEQKKLRTVASPLVIDGTLFITSGNGPGDRDGVAVRLSGQGEISDANVLWEMRKTVPYVPCMVARDEHLYFVNDEGIAGCIDARTGKIRWQNRLDGRFTSSPVLIDGRVYAFSETGNVSVFAADRAFRLLHTSTLSEGVMASPAVVDGHLLVRGTQHLYCFGPQ